MATNVGLEKVEGDQQMPEWDPVEGLLDYPHQAS